ncbi:hypothetical protein [Amycolatopsis cihanbeyliensis]|uniref:Uncharacterized protein n=1 Tax=Amycolatopsis cihanbeyliensis TaxID=1128664 RepID=A0A542DQJ5_AMYCI|nr:hypothetical protein [Amycolatopsis cihanbeyliensis]TQJ05381.1 hypothetical protein FB471_5210 [Amycolatopsis cihanbeyliensis]
MPGGQWSSSRLALVAAVANLTVCAAVGTTLLVVSAPGEVRTGTALPIRTPGTTESATVPGTTPPTTTNTTTTGVPAGLERTPGPNGFSTVVPRGWPTEPLSGPGAVQAADPEDGTRTLRYGGAAHPAAGILEWHTDYERQVSEQREGYRLLELNETTLRGFPAVVWEFEWDAPEGRRHTRSMYWRTGGIEYFVYAASRVRDWPDTEPILTAMIEHSRP